MKFHIQQAVELLRQTPEILNSLLGNLSDDWTEKEDSESWNPFDIVGHLIHGEEIDWIPRVEIIVAQGENRTFQSFDRFAQFEKSKGKSLNQLLETFARLRKGNLEKLQRMNLTSEQLGLNGIHPELGKVNL